MMYKSEDHLVKEIAYRLSNALNNEVIHIHHEYNVCKDSVSMRFEFVNKEHFGHILREEIYFSHFQEFTPETIVKGILSKTIDNLPRADRLERMRMWGIK